MPPGLVDVRDPSVGGEYIVVRDEREAYALAGIVEREGEIEAG